MLSVGKNEFLHNNRCYGLSHNNELWSLLQALPLERNMSIKINLSHHHGRKGTKLTYSVPIGIEQLSEYIPKNQSDLHFG